MVIALLGVWTSVAVVWFDLVDYEEVLGKNFKERFLSTYEIKSPLALRKAFGRTRSL